MPSFFLAKGEEHYKLHWATGGGGLCRGGLCNSKVSNSDNETAATRGGRLWDGKVRKEDSTCISKRLRKVGLQELGINPRVRKGEVDNWLLRQIVEYKQNKKVVVVTSVDLFN
jgi:hypothetical protein